MATNRKSPGGEILLTVPDAAARIGLDRSMVRRYCAEGRLPAQRIGRDWLIRWADLNAFTRRPAHRPAKAS